MDIVEIAKKRFTSKAYDAQRRLNAEQQYAIIELLRNSPSSLNLQPWHFHIIRSESAKQKILPAMFELNSAKVKSAPEIIVFSALNRIESEHFSLVTAKEDKDGRYADHAARDKADQGRRGYLANNGGDEQQMQRWMERQIYIALGFLLLGAPALGINATPIEGFDNLALDKILDLGSQNLHSVVIAAIGYNNDEDFNADLPKSRLDSQHVVTVL